MFGIKEMQKKLQDLETSNILLKREVLSLKENSVDKLVLRKEIGKAINALLANESDGGVSCYTFPCGNDFIKHFTTFISNQTRVDVRTNFELEFNNRINEKFIDAIVERINRKQVG